MATLSPASLTVTAGLHQGARVELVLDRLLLIGGDPNCDVVLADPGLAGQQLALLAQAGSLTLRALADGIQLDGKSLAAGASGYLLKRTSHVRILDAIEEVHGGGSPMTGTIARRIVQAVQRHRTEANAQPYGTTGRDDRLLNLSPREQEVLSLLARGFRYKEIAESLGITVETVRTHLRRIYEKLHVSTRTEAVVRFLRK